MTQIGILYQVVLTWSYLILTMLMIITLLALPILNTLKINLFKTLRRFRLLCRQYLLNNNSQHSLCRLIRQFSLDSKANITNLSPRANPILNCYSITCTTLKYNPYNLIRRNLGKFSKSLFKIDISPLFQATAT
jgi:hypothetical protein